MTKEILKNKIIELKDIFDKQKQIFRPQHLMTRRIGSFHGFLFLITLLLGLCVELTSFSYEMKNDKLFNTSVVAGVVVWLCSIGRLIYLKRDKPTPSVNATEKEKKREEEKFKEKFLVASLFWSNSSVLLLYIIVLVTYKTSNMIVLLSGLFFLIYLGCYLSNKQHGYTRGWARNETYYFLLDSLEWEVDQLDGINNISSNLKLDKLAKKFTHIIEAQLHERQRDIIGDYLSTNDAAFSWIKNIKK